MPLITRTVGALALLLTACSSTGETGTPRIPCTSQASCEGGKNYELACASGYCSTPFESGYLANLTMGVRDTRLKLQGIQSFRVWSIYPLRPDGTEVKCPAVGGTLSDLGDPTKTNLAAPVAEKNFAPGQNDTILFAVRLNGPGRIVYAEMYKGQLDLTAPGEEGPAIGTGCVENADYSGTESSPSTVLFDVKPVDG